MAGEDGPAGQELNLMFLVLRYFPHLSQSEKIWGVFLHFRPILFSYGLSSNSHLNSFQRIGFLFLSVKVPIAVVHCPTA